MLQDNASTPPLVLDVMAATYQGLQADPAPGVVFTDDRAPVEQITNSIVLNFLMAGEMENLE